jgi:DNA polymerase
MRKPSAARQRRPAAKADKAGGQLIGRTPLAALEREAAGCTRCPLYKNATQTVFGEGPQDAVLVFVGEQPGDREDREGRPFVGPAGALFDRALAEAGIARGKVYVTNAVKHFKFQPRGKRRIHQKPNAGEVTACKWWLDRELAAIGPALVVALGATAARSLAGRIVPIMKNRGPADFQGHAGFITVHPSSLLRVPEHDRKAEAYKAFIADLRRIRRMLEAEDAAA